MFVVADWLAHCFVSTVKVLYTFDSDNKTNCLARFPDILSVPTIPIDDNTQIGVIELRTCIRAIVGASPELVSRLSQGDFTIYAYDYSEYETPLVGQGMLSSILAAQSPTPTAPAHQSKTMITGRVCKNIMGLFNNGVQETLEVKLRLVPVPKPVQNEYVKSMEVYRNLNSAMSGGFDPNAWSESMQTNTPLETSLDNMTGYGFPGQEMIDQESRRPSQHNRQMSDASFQGRPTTSGYAARGSAPVSRVGTPIMHAQNASVSQHDQGRRPLSRSSVRGERPQRAREESFSQPGAERYNEEEPARKRAKITQADWRGKSTFGAPPDSLRVTASTAASIRIHKPVPTRPNGLGNSSLEPPPRVPTPVPRGNPAGLSRGRSQTGSLLRRESSLMNTQSQYQSYDQSTYANSDAVMSSPEEDQLDVTAEGTPLDFPSSPPAMPVSSSPRLPGLPRPMDSGYMSGNAFEFLEDDENRFIDEEDMQVAAQYQQRPQLLRSDISFVEQTPGPPELLPKKMQPGGDRPQSKDALSRANLSQQNAMNAALPPVHRRSSIALPPRPPQLPNQSSSSEAINILSKQDQEAQRPNMRGPSVSHTMRSEAASPAPSEDPSVFGKLPRSGSGARRKKCIQDKLKSSIASGAMPMFCCNCGAIETPTWRSVHIKVVEGSPEDNDLKDSEGVTQGIETMEKDPESGNITRFRIIKSMRKSRDRVEMQGYETMSVCNRKLPLNDHRAGLTGSACGLWFNKFKYMRPSEKWNRNPKQQKKKQSTKKNSLQSDMAEPQLDFFTDGPAQLWTDQVQPDDVVEEQDNQNDNDPQQHVFQPPAKRQRANSMQARQPRPAAQGLWTGAELGAALHRAIQSSPARFVGTQESPIELEDDLTPRPTRRLLFPSPRKDGESISLDDSALPAPSVGMRGGGGDHTFALAKEALVPETIDKENLPPLDADDEFAHLFEGSPGSLLFFKTPSKRTPSKLTPPSKSIPSFDALLATPTPSRRVASLTRTPTHTNIDAFLPTFSSSETKNLFPSTPSRFNALTSPSRGTGSDAAMTPFTRHLTQMLHGANSGNCNSDLGFGSSSSPGRPFDFGDLNLPMPTFLTPGRDFGNLGFEGFEDFDVQQGSAEGKIKVEVDADGHGDNGVREAVGGGNGRGGEDGSGNASV